MKRDKWKIFISAQAMPASEAWAVIEPMQGGPRVKLAGNDAAQFREGYTARAWDQAQQYARRVYSAALALETGAGSAKRMEPLPLPIPPDPPLHGRFNCAGRYVMPEKGVKNE